MPVAAAVAPGARFNVVSVSVVSLRSSVPMFWSAPIVIAARPGSAIFSVAPGSVASVSTAAGSYPFTVPVPDITMILPAPPMAFGVFAPAPMISAPSTVMPFCAVHVLPAATVAVASGRT